MRANLNSQLKSWLKVGTNIAYSRTNQYGVQERQGAASNPFDVARSWAPIFPVHAYDAEGNMKYDEKGNPIYDAGTGQVDGTTKRPVATNQNVICSMSEDIRKSEYHNLSSRSYIEIKLPLNFKFVANYSYDYTNLLSTVYYTPTIGDGASFGGRGTKSNASEVTSNFNQILSYETHLPRTTTSQQSLVMSTTSTLPTHCLDRRPTSLTLQILNLTMVDRYRAFQATSSCIT